MQDIFGEELKKILQNSKIQVPKAYDKRIEETLSNISAKEKKPYLHFFLFEDSSYDYDMHYGVCFFPRRRGGN